MATKLTPAQIKAKLASFEAKDYRAFRKFVSDQGGTYETTRTYYDGFPQPRVEIFVDLPDYSFRVSRTEGWADALDKLKSEIADARQPEAA